MQAYLTFDGKAAEALDFYARVLGGKILFSMKYGESPMASQTPPEAKDRLMHATLEARGHQLMASDAPPGVPFEGHKGFALSVQESDAKAGEQLFNALADGGQVTMAYGATFWAAGFGMLIDRFGVPWMVNVENPAFKPA